MEIMTGNEYQEAAARFINKDLTEEQRRHHGLFGMIAELSEISGALLNLNNANTMQDKIEAGNHLKKEVGDCMWFIAEYAGCYSLYLDDLIEGCFPVITKTLTDSIVGLCDIEQKRYQGHEANPKLISVYLSAVVDYLMSQVYNLGFKEYHHDWVAQSKKQLSNALDINIDKLSKRYPNGFESERSLHRAEGDD